MMLVSTNSPLTPSRNKATNSTSEAALSFMDELFVLLDAQDCHRKVDHITSEFMEDTTSLVSSRNPGLFKVFH